MPDGAVEVCLRTRVVGEQGPALAGSHQHLGSAGLAQKITVFTGRIHFELVVRMLDHGNAQPPFAQAANDLLQQSGFSGAAEGDQPKHGHSRIAQHELPPSISCVTSA